MYSPSVKDYLNHRKVRFGDVTYDYYVTLGNGALQSIYQRLKDLDADRFVIVADQGLTPKAIREIEQVFREFAPTVVLPAQACEKDKSLGTLDDLAEKAIQSGITRRSVVVALGGGIVGNVAGLLAGLLFRGIRLVHVPTTLLSMSDSVLSLKQAVNSRLGKNHLGVFHPPILVWSRIEFMDTLPVEEIQSGTLRDGQERTRDLPRTVRRNRRQAQTGRALFGGGAGRFYRFMHRRQGQGDVRRPSGKA
jgi:3-dehydroquinate synthetase